MIFIFQDESKIPQEWLQRVANLQEQLEALPDAATRGAFIDGHSSVWRDIKDQLLEMSGFKCWYSEAPDAVSDWHVDHFRPKKRALDEDKTEHEGYHWLAFDWKNYRIAGSYSNSPHGDGNGVTRGKWDYFPLANGSVRANWHQRDCSGEICLLLDPTDRGDPMLMTFDEQGLPIPTAPDNAIVRKRVETTVHLLHLDHDRLVRARKKKWRDTQNWIEAFYKACPNEYESCTPLDHERLQSHLDTLPDLTGSGSAYAATARACLHAFNLPQLAQPNEEVPLASGC